MALNLWTTGGKASSYNPLPTGTGNYVPVTVNNFVLTFSASSASGATIKIQDNTKTIQYITLTKTLSQYTVNLESPVKYVFIVDNYSSGDIFIQNIQLIQQPLPSYTINEVDGFLSGKWTLHADTTVIDDHTIAINATGQFRQNTIDIPVSPNTTYSYSHGKNQVDAYSYLDTLDINHNVVRSAFYTSISVQPTNNLSTIFTTGSSEYYIRIHLLNDNNFNNNPYILYKPMINLGTVPAPYEPKRSAGATMAMPTPVTDNLMPDFSKWTLAGTAQVVNGVLIFNSIGDTAKSPYIPVNVNNSSNFSFSADYFGAVGTPVNNGNPGRLVNSSYYDATFHGVNNRDGYQGNGNASAFSLNTWTRMNVPFSGGSAIKYIQYSISTNSSWTAASYQVKNPMLTLDGKTAYVPYSVQENKSPLRSGSPLPANTGMKFNGVSDSITFPDSPDLHLSTFSLECLVNLTTLKDYGVLVQKGEGGGTSQFNYALWSYGSGNLTFFIGNGTTTLSAQSPLTRLTNQWVHVVATYDNSGLKLYFNGSMVSYNTNTINPIQNTANLYIGKYGVSNNASPNGTMKYANIYNRALSASEVTSRYNGVLITQGLVRNYDLTNPLNIAGNTFLMGQQNLFPSFEDARWMNTTNNQYISVLGKDVLHFNGGGNTVATYILPVQPNQSFLQYCSTNNDTHGYFQINWQDSNHNSISWTPDPISATVTAPSNAAYARLYLTNKNNYSYELLRPQLYLLTGQEGTINGSPVMGVKPSQRTLYNKR